MFFSRMVSNLLSSKNSSSSKNGKSGALATNDELVAKKPNDKSQKVVISAVATSTSSIAAFSSPGTSPKQEQKTLKIGKSPKEDVAKAKVSAQSKRSRNEKNSFMSLAAKKKSVKKRGISMPINGLESIVDIKNVNKLDEPTTSASATAFTSVWRPGTLYSDVVSGAGPSTSKKRNDLVGDMATATTPKNAATAAPTATIVKPIASTPTCSTDNLSNPHHHLFPSLSESRKFATARSIQEPQNDRGEGEPQEHSNTEPLPVPDSPVEFDIIDTPERGTQLSPTASVARLSIQFSEMSLDSSSLSASASLTTGANTLPESLPTPEFSITELNHEDDDKSAADALVKGKVANAESGSQNSNNTDVSTIRDCNGIDRSTPNTLPEWNFTPATACVGFPTGMGMFDDERYLYYERLSWLGLKLAMGDKKW